MWIESHASLRNHRKLLRFMAALKINRAEAIGYLHMLWWWVAECSSDGDLSLYPPQDIANGAGWSGKPERLLNALRDAGFLDGNTIHDWPDYIGRLLAYRERKRQQAAQKRREKFRNYSDTRAGTIPEQFQSIPYRREQQDPCQDDDEPDPTPLDPQEPPEAESDPFPILSFSTIPNDPYPDVPITSARYLPKPLTAEQASSLTGSLVPPSPLILASCQPKPPNPHFVHPSKEAKAALKRLLSKSSSLGG